MEKLIDMKLPKPTKADLKTEAMPMKLSDRDRWPWGLRINLDKEQIDKLPGIENLKVGDSVLIHGIGSVTSVRISERAEGKPDHSIEIQIEKVSIGSEKNPKPENLNMKSYRAMREGKE